MQLIALEPGTNPQESLLDAADALTVLLNPLGVQPRAAHFGLTALCALLVVATVLAHFIAIAQVRLP